MGGNEKNYKESLEMVVTGKKKEKKKKDGNAVAGTGFL